MRKQKTPAGRRERVALTEGIPLVVIFSGFGLALAGYTISRFVFASHPLHWASGIGGLLLGLLIGYLWYLTHGDVTLF